MNLYDHFNMLHGKRKFKVEPPGTISYNGQYNNVKVSIECIEYDDSNVLTRKVDEIEGPFEKDKTYWFNVVGLWDAKLIKNIGDSFGIHHMDLEDIVHVSQWSKIEVKDKYLFAILKMIYLKGKETIHEHLAIIKEENVIITFQEIQGDIFDEIRTRLEQKHGKIRDKGSDYLFYVLLDTLVDQYFIIINRISSDFKDLEIRIVDNDISSKEKIYSLRKELVYLINSIFPIKDSVKILIGNQQKDIVNKEILPYYGDLLEHLNQITDSLEAFKEMTNNLNEIHMTNVSNKMNKIMMTLTVFSAIFIPLSFLAGVFGMNFEYIPGLNIKEAFYVFISICIIIASGMLLYFKHKKWY